MSTTAQGAPHRVARILNIALNVVIILLVLFVLIMGTGAFMMLIDSPVKEMVIDKLNETGRPVPSSMALTSGYVGAAIIAGAYLYVALVVKRIVQTTLNGTPFDEANISRLRKTWIVIALVEIFRMVLVGVIPNTSQDGTALDSFTLETRLSAWFLVFVIAIMAEVFRVGLELKRDQELTV